MSGQTLSVTAGGQTVAQTVQMTDPADLLVRAVDGSSNRISGATVTVTGPSPSSSNATGSPALTASNGEISFAQLLDGSYTVHVFPPPGSSLVGGYYDSAVARGHWAADSSAATPITVSGADVTGIDVALPIGHTISGTITDSAGNPVAGASIYASLTGSCPCAGATTSPDGTM